MTAIPAVYNPNNWTSPFEGEQSPEDFVLADLDFILDYPNGLTELTESGPEIHGSALPIKYRQFAIRTFVMKASSGEAALVRLDGDYVDENMVLDYLKHHAKHVNGLIIREMGLLGAAIYDAVCAFADDPSIKSQLNDTIALETVFDLPSARVAGRLASSHVFLARIATIEIQKAVPRWQALLWVDSPIQANWHHWEQAKSLLPQWVHEGSVPFGLSTYSGFDVSLPYQVRPIPLRGKSANIVGRVRGMSLCDIYIITDPDGTVCMMAVNSLDGMRKSGRDFEGEIIDWSRRHFPAMTNYVANHMHSEWAHHDALILELASALLRENRVRGDKVAWHLPEVPTVTHPDRDSAAPYVLDAVIIETGAFGLDMLMMMRDG